MHRISATATGWTPDIEGVIVVEQTPGEIIILTAADTDIQTLASALDYLPDDFPSIRALNLLQLQQQFSIDDYGDKVLSVAKTIVLRLLGGRSYWSYGLEVVKEIALSTGADLWVLPGDEKLDPLLIDHSTVSVSHIHQLWRYFTEGGVDNWVNALKFIANTSLGYAHELKQASIVSKIGLLDRNSKRQKFLGRAAILFYRSHYLAGNTRAIQSLCQILETYNIEPLPIFVSSLKEPDIQESLVQDFLDDSVDLILNTTSFAIASLHGDNKTNFWQTLNLPVFQIILSSGTESQWEEGYQGLSPRDVAMNIALPEVDGRIITRAVSFKSVQVWEPRLETSIVVYQPREDRVKFVVQLGVNWIKLRHKANQDKKIVMVLANYPNKDGRLANGVGLDTPASCIEILRALKEDGYAVTDIPADGDELIKLLTAGVTNDVDNNELRAVYQSLSLEDYQSYFQSLPSHVQEAMIDRWGVPSENIPISGIRLGNIFISIQPSRGYDIDPSLNYHAPDLEPTHAYLAHYYWLRSVFEADAVIHVGKHGNLEWLPGKSLALSTQCYPEIALQTLPNFYPFIVNDPGEGSQAKRRAHAVILDHLTPPLTRAGLYGDLSALEALIDEYYEAQSLDPSRLKIISRSIQELVSTTGIDRDLGVDASDLNKFLTLADGYLCELKEAQIRDGLHIFGLCPAGEQLRDLILSIARSPGLKRLGLTRAIARDLAIDFDPLSPMPLSRPSPILSRLFIPRRLGYLYRGLCFKDYRWGSTPLRSAYTPGMGLD
ncbi:MAG: Aerobic cobaltochelatase subunit CobN [Chroococcopsis gigantea SAG 12.99]|nr:Aerobic cobaltochelatase subunit CobN [Chroococcopsis gigantea SAG 12.99]